MPSTTPASFFGGMASPNSTQPPARMITVFRWPTCAARVSEQGHSCAPGSPAAACASLASRRRRLGLG